MYLCQNVKQESADLPNFSQYCKMILLVLHQFLGELIKRLIDTPYDPVHSVASLTIKEILT